MLVSCVVYKDGRKMGDIDPKDIHLYLSEPGCFVWVALRDPDETSLRLMQEEFDLHPLAVEDTLNGGQRPKIEEYGPSLFAVLRTLEPDNGELRVGEVNIFAGPNYIMTVRSHAERGFQEVRARAEREPEQLKLGSGYVLYALIDAVVDRYFPTQELLEEELEQLEERIFSRAASPRANIEALYALKQKLTQLKHAVSPLQEAVFNMSGARIPAVCSGLREYFRDIYDHLLRLNQSADSLRETVATAISVNLAMITLQENETMKRLAAYAALVAVPTMIAGIYGMNFVHMPELSWRYGYGTVLAAMAVIDALIFYKLRKAKWL